MRTLVDIGDPEVKALDRLAEMKAVSGAEERCKAEHDKLKAQRYREIYIHSKLMLIDDSFFTLGSANLNLRSMEVDSELNVSSDDPGVSAALRKRVWELHTGGADKCNPPGWVRKGEDSVFDAEAMAKAFEKWEKLMHKNRDAKYLGQPLTGFLVPFKDERTSRIRVG